MSPIRH